MKKTKKKKKKKKPGLSAVAAIKLFDKPIFNPPEFLMQWLIFNYHLNQRLMSFLFASGLLLCQISLNQFDKAFSFSIDLAILFDQYIDIQTAAFFGIFLSATMGPKKIFASTKAFSNVISANSVFFGPILGIMISDYFLVRNRRIKLSEIYSPSKLGIYYYRSGINWRALISWLCGLLPQMPGFINAIHSSVKVNSLYTKLLYMSFPLGIILSFATHSALNILSPPARTRDIDNIDYYHVFTEQERSSLGGFQSRERFNVPWWRSKSSSKVQKKEV